jgi:hypothetical protein
MGRAIILILSSLILTLTLINKTEGLTKNDPPDQWDSFIAQYRLLVSDGKDELAERMWKNTYPEMEKYAQALSPEEYDLWSMITQDIEEMDQGLRLNVEPIFLFLEATSSNNAGEILEKRLQHLVRLVEQEQSSSRDIIKQWDMVRPVINSYTNKEEIILVDESLNEWTMAGSDTTKTAVVNSLNKLMKPSEDGKSAAMLWMIVIIGGSIIFTLSYVGVRMYQGRSKNRHNLKSGNS